MPPDDQRQEFITPNILSCNGNQLWVSWLAGKIQVGFGTVLGQSQKFEWTDPQPISIHAFSLASQDDKVVSWTFLRDTGNDFFRN